MRKNKKKDEKETTSEQMESTDATRQLTEKEVFEDDEEKGLTYDQAIETGILEKEAIKEPQKDGESMRQVVLKLLEQGKTKDDIAKLTGYPEKTITRYMADWTDSQLSVARKLIADGRWGLVKRIVEVIDKKETFLVEDGKLYYPGRDKLTYVFLASTIIELIAIIVLFFY